jgi:UDP-glucose 4-epimerase
MSGRALVTGGAGFIGSHLVERLLREGYAVRVLDNLSTGKLWNLATVANDIELIEADIRDARRVDLAVLGCEFVFHEAAIVSVPYSVENPQETHDVNLQGTLNVLLAARSRGVRRVVFASSAAVYGEDPVMPKRETMLTAPVTPYGVEKMASELYLATFHALYGIETVSLRYFNVFGVRQDPASAYSGVISIFVDRALRKIAPVIFGDGTQYRDFVDVENVVDANVLAATRAGISGRVYNIGCGHKTRLDELVATIGRAIGNSLPAIYAPARAGDIRESVADITRAQDELGYAPKTSVEKGLARLVEHSKRNFHRT